MNIEQIREYCLSQPDATEDMPFGEDYLVIRICDKIFACIGLTRPDYFVVKCDPERAIELRERYPEIRPAWHWNKKYWIEISLTGSLDDNLIQTLIRHSYTEVLKKLPKRISKDLIKNQPILNFLQNNRS